MELAAYTVVCCLLASPALAGDYTFVIDESQSSVMMRFGGSPLYAWGTSPLAGTFRLSLGDPTPGTPNVWNVVCSFKDIDAYNTNTLTPGFGVGEILVLEGDFQLGGVDPLGDNDVLLTGGPPISSGTFSPEIGVEITGRNAPHITPDNPEGWLTIDQWYVAIPPVVDVQVADDDYLGVILLGTPEAVFEFYGVVPLEAAGATAYLDVYVTLAGAAPEPATSSFLALGSLFVLLRRRRA